MDGQEFNILLVEDDDVDVRAIQRAFTKSNISNQIYVANDGIEALDMLRGTPGGEAVPAPHIILLDLNMPRMGGHEFLEKIKADEQFNTIPIVVLTTSDADQDIVNSYRLQASCHITKPVDLKQFSKVVRSIEEFWICVVKLPPKEI